MKKHFCQEVLLFVSFLLTILIIVIYNKNATSKLFKLPN